MINWTVVGQQVDNTSDIRRSTTAVYRTDRQALSTARFCRAGQLATIDTRCYILISPLNRRPCVPRNNPTGLQLITDRLRGNSTHVFERPFTRTRYRKAGILRLTQNSTVGQFRWTIFFLDISRGHFWTLRMWTWPRRN